MALPGTWNAIKATLSADEELGGPLALVRTEPGRMEFCGGGMLLLNHPTVDEAKVPTTYNPHELACYWRQRPEAVSVRLQQILGVCGELLPSLTWDLINGNLEDKANQVQYTGVLTEMLIMLGPAFIKFGQTLSSRADLFSDEVLQELRSLCYMVPSFSTDQALHLIEEELGAPLHELYDGFLPEPTAAASLGQVYKARIKATGTTVAVKVQRPRVLQTLACDLFLLRRVCVALRSLPQTNSIDLVGVVDELAMSMFNELDYTQEMRNAEYFATSIRHLPLIEVPQCYEQLCSRRVLTMDWLYGKHITDADENQVQGLVRVGVQCYLSQLLNTGFVHADPHPGNLMCLDGSAKLGIIDFGQVIGIPDDLKYLMLEACAHLYHRDYGLLVQDVQKLGAITSKADMGPLEADLERIMGGMVERKPDGSMAVTTDFNQLLSQFDQLQRRYTLMVPTSLVSLSRAIGMLEGIALEVNPEFNIVSDSFPFILGQLIQDPHPRVRGALRFMVYGPTGVFDMQRFIRLVEILEANSLLSNPPTPAPVDVMESRLSAQVAATSQPPAERDPDAFEPRGRSTHRLGVEGFLVEGVDFLRPKVEPAPQPTQPQQTSEPSASQLFGADELDPAEKATILEMKANVAEVRKAVSALVADEFFREVLVEEVARGIDAVNRTTLSRFMLMLGLQKVRVPLPVPGAGSLLSLVPLSPKISTEDRYAIDNGKALLYFIVKRVHSHGGNPVPVQMTASLVMELLPLVVNVAAELMPEIWTNLIARMQQRMLVELRSTK